MEQDGWIKLHRRILRDEKVRSLSTARRWIWVTMLLMASQEEDTMGELRSPQTRRPYSLDDIADASGELKMTVSRTVKQLEELGMIERLTEAKGRMPGLVRVVKFGRYQHARSVTDSVTGELHKPAKPRSVTACVTPSVTDSVTGELHNGPASPENAQAALSLEVEEVEDTSKATPSPPSEGATDASRGGQHAALVDQLWDLLGIPGKPASGRNGTYGFVGRRVNKGLGLQVVIDMVAHLEKHGPRQEYDETCEPPEWFKREFNWLAECAPGKGWRAQLARETEAAEAAKVDETVAAAAIEKAAEEQAWRQACTDYPEGFVKWKVMRAMEPQKFAEVQSRYQHLSGADFYREMLADLDREMRIEYERKTTAEQSPP